MCQSVYEKFYVFFVKLFSTLCNIWSIVRIIIENRALCIKCVYIFFLCSSTPSSLWTRFRAFYVNACSSEIGFCVLKTYLRFVVCFFVKLFSTLVDIWSRIRLIIENRSFSIKSFNMFFLSIVSVVRIVFPC